MTAVSRPTDPAVIDALEQDHLVALPGVGGYQLAARSGSDAVPALVALAAADDVPYFAIGHLSHADQVAPAWSKEIRSLAVRFWPGPLLLVVGAGDEAVRLTMPPARAVRKVCRRIGPLVMVPATAVDGDPLREAVDVRRRYAVDEVAVVVDAGRIGGEGPSILSTSHSPPVILFEGALPRQFIEGALLLSTRKRWRSKS